MAGPALLLPPALGVFIVLGIELRILCLQSKNFANWPSPHPLWLLLKPLFPSLCSWAVVLTGPSLWWQVMVFLLPWSLHHSWLAMTPFVWVFSQCSTDWLTRNGKIEVLNGPGRGRAGEADIKAQGSNGVSASSCVCTWWLFPCNIYRQGIGHSSPKAGYVRAEKQSICF